MASLLRIININYHSHLDNALNSGVKFMVINNQHNKRISPGQFLIGDFKKNLVTLVLVGIFE